MKTRNRGAAIAVMVLLLAAVQIVVIGGLAGSVDEADEGVRRLISTRAQFASDGAGMIISRQVQRGLTVPSAGTVWQIGSSTATVVSAPATLTSGEIRVDVRSDAATRRLRITLGLSGQ
jgi:hypothetical protein